jgi:hypothetical protein
MLCTGTNGCRIQLPCHKLPHVEHITQCLHSVDAPLQARCKMLAASLQIHTARHHAIRCLFTSQPALCSNCVDDAACPLLQLVFAPCCSAEVHCTDLPLYSLPSTVHVAPDLCDPYRRAARC